MVSLAVLPQFEDERGREGGSDLLKWIEILLMIERWTQHLTDNDNINPTISCHFVFFRICESFSQFGCGE